MITTISCKPTNFKMLLLDTIEFDRLSASTGISLDLYLKLFLANVSQHSQSDY